MLRTGNTLLLVMALAACGGGDEGDESDRSPESVEFVRFKTYEVVNSARTGCGFPALSTDSRLEAAAEAHANYLRLNKGSGHDQLPEQPGFVGRTPNDRAKHFGANYEWVGEGISYRKYAEDAMRDLLAAPYHGKGLLWDYYETMGVSAAPPFVINRGIVSWRSRLPNRVLHYPCEGTTGVKALQDGETPSPFPGHGDQSWGHPVYLFGKRMLKLDSVVIRNDKGEVPIRAIYGGGHSSDPNGRVSSNEAVIIPNALADLTRYSVSIQGRDGSSAFSLNFHFETGQIRP